MALYYVLIGAFSFLGLLLFRKGDTTSRRTIFLLAVFFVLWLFASFRYHVGYDYSYIYGPHYSNEVLARPDYNLSTAYYEPAFVVLEMIMSRLSMHYQFFFVATSGVFLILLVFYFYHHSPLIPVSLLTLFFLGEYYASLNFIRQSIAAVITCFSVTFLMRRKFHWYLLVILLAACFHKSALIMIPFYFINLIPLLSKKLLALYLFGAASAYVLLPHIVRFITTYWYSLYVEDNEYMMIQTPWPFAVFAGILFLILFFCRDTLISENRKNYVYINYCFFAFFFVLMGTRFSVIHRMFYYFEFPLTVGVAILIRNLWKNRDKSVFPRKPLLVTALLTVWGLSFHHYALDMDVHGVVPYYSVLSQSFYPLYVSEIYGPVPRLGSPTADDEPPAPFIEVELEPTLKPSSISSSTSMGDRLADNPSPASSAPSSSAPASPAPSSSGNASPSGGFQIVSMWISASLSPAFDSVSISYHFPSSHSSSVQRYRHLK